MKKLLGSICIIIISVLVINFNYAAAQEEEAEATAPVVKKAAVKKTAVKKAPAKKTAAKATAEKKGETLSSLIKTFNSVHKDIEFAQKYVNPKSEEFDRTMAKALANDLLKWKKAKIQIKKLKKDKSPKLKASEEKLKELEENILAKYTESAAPVEPEESASAADENEAAGEDAIAKTEKGKEILEKLRQKRASETESSSNEEGGEAEKTPVEKAEVEKPAVKTTSKLRINPVRALYNRMEPGAEGSARITLRNQAKSTYEGTVVPIENWISVNPTVVTIEPGSSIDVEVIVTSQETSKTRLEGTIELRTEGESSKRIPVVVRTK